MYTLKIEKYLNDYHNSHMEIRVNNFEEIGKWLISKKEGSSSHFFPQYNQRNKKEIYHQLYVRDNKFHWEIHLIKRDSDNGIIYSSGRFTNSKKHISKEFLDYCIQLDKDIKDNAIYNFIE